ncbi:hypothetical protein MVES1_002131 [Malassezia vespertilionis]|uniref:Transcription initiation factor TFIID subunit 4 n=1 Tax=Malassezia vespertilionis TaxID=2020962 RepID=A0A2N1JC95_9BASI|nr:uncharacterized protein MVES1_002131 [Malassezia vespertilionis]PKI84164.1 hypothetical protein MVES_002010 [Malassezia vespertilionis]WFD06777.1 hypothetical protein MVES1_002131 [Malassezia vespertilionis]
MEKRAEERGADDGRQPKKIKTEHVADEVENVSGMGESSDATLGAVASPHVSSTPPSAPAQLPAAQDARSALGTMSPGMSNLDRLANIAAQTQRTDGANVNPLLHTPTNPNLPLSLQRLQAVRSAHGSPMQGTPSGSNPGLAQPSMASSYDNLMDVMGFSGVDLRAEEVMIQQSSSLWEDASQSAAAVLNGAGSGQGLYLNIYPLSSMVHRIARQYGLKVDAATLDYLSIATRMRFRNLVESMVRSSRHRTNSSHQRKPVKDANGNPAYHEVLLSNPAKQLAAIEKADRIDEGNWRRLRLEREEAEAAAQEAAIAGEENGTPRNDARKSKRPSTSGRNLSEDVRKKLADSTAMRHLGANSITSKYAWLQSPGMRTSGPKSVREKEAGAEKSTATPSSNLPKPKFAPQQSTRLAPSHVHAGAWSDVAARQAAQREHERMAKARVTLLDALAALEREQAGGAGRGSGSRALYRARAWGKGRGSY